VNQPKKAQCKGRRRAEKMGQGVSPGLGVYRWEKDAGNVEYRIKKSAGECQKNRGGHWERRSVQYRDGDDVGGDSLRS